MNPFIEKNKDMLVIVGIVLISFLVAKKAHDANTAKCDLLKSKIKTEEDKASALGRIVVSNEKLKQIRDRGWQTTNFEAIVQRVTELGAASDIKILQIMPGQKKPHDDYTGVPFSFTGQTTYKNLQKFLKSLQQEKKLMLFIDISIAPGSTSSGSDSDVPLALSFTGEALYFS